MQFQLFSNLQENNSISSFTFKILFLVVIFASCSEATLNENAPKISNIFPNEGTSERIVVIEGSRFSPIASENIVTFNGVEAVVISFTPSDILGNRKEQLRVVAPSGSGSGPITVTTKSGTSKGPVFTFVPPTAPPDYYITFHSDGVPQLFSDSNPVTNHCNSCSCYTMYSGETDVMLSICQSELVNPEMIEDLNGKTIPLRSNAGYPFGRFVFKNVNYFYDSNTLNNLSSFLTISDIQYLSSKQGADLYVVTGSFEGLIENLYDPSTISVSQGEFRIGVISSISR